MRVSTLGNHLANPRRRSFPCLPSPSPPPRVSKQVYRAICKQHQEEVAVKLLDLENMNCSLDEIVREAQVRAGAPACTGAGGSMASWRC